MFYFLKFSIILMKICDKKLSKKNKNKMSNQSNDYIQYLNSVSEAFNYYFLIIIIPIGLVGNLVSGKFFKDLTQLIIYTLFIYALFIYRYPFTSTQGLH